MQPNTRFPLGRRSVLKGAGAGLILGASPAVGFGGARGPTTQASVEILSDSVQVTPAGAAIVTSATLPKGGFIAVWDRDQGGAQFLGATEPALGRGTFPHMMVRLDADILEPGLNTLTAEIFWDLDGNREFDEDIDESYGVRDSKDVTFNP